MPKKRNSIAKAMELRLFCIKPSICLVSDYMSTGSTGEMGSNTCLQHHRPTTETLLSQSETVHWEWIHGVEILLEQIDPNKIRVIPMC